VPEFKQSFRLEDIKQDEDQDKNQAISIIGSFINDCHTLLPDPDLSDDDIVPIAEEAEFEEEVMPNVRLSIRKDLESSQSSFEYAMNFMYLNFSDKENNSRFPELVNVPVAIRPEYVLKPSFEAY
jgi:hypothetical protein